MIDVLDTLRASLAPHYDVEREIGAGGMARVFLAVEQHPHRGVAIKVLDPEVSTRLLRERFIREVDLSSNLSHPHIVPIFSAGEVDGLFYYVMPYVEGESLRHRLLRDRDRKSTRLNSSHSQISYAVFCLKKKKCKTSTHQFFIALTMP